MNALSDAERAEKFARIQQAFAEYGRSGSDLFAEVSSDVLKAEQRALRFLSQRARSRYEIRNKLRSLDYEEQCIATVVQRLESAGYIDDAEFARQWVQQRSKTRGKSRRVLAMELKEKGVAEHHVEQALAELDPEDEKHQARMIAEKRAARIHAIPEGHAAYNKELRRIVSCLARRGFPQGLCMQLGTAALHNRLDELDELASPD